MATSWLYMTPYAICPRGHFRSGLRQSNTKKQKNILKAPSYFIKSCDEPFQNGTPRDIRSERVHPDQSWTDGRVRVDTVNSAVSQTTAFSQTATYMLIKQGGPEYI
ncbi:unnamed protein product [Boreogadus saida]